MRGVTTKALRPQHIRQLSSRHFLSEFLRAWRSAAHGPPEASNRERPLWVKTKRQRVGVPLRRTAWNEFLKEKWAETDSAHGYASWATHDFDHLSEEWAFHRNNNTDDYKRWCCAARNSRSSGQVRARLLDPLLV
eukprot:4970288-Karenia_brevis.AAC.1